MNWQMKIYLASWVGAFLGLFYPLSWAWFNFYFRKAEPPAFQPFRFWSDNKALNLGILLVLGIAISAVVSLLNYVTYLGTEENQTKLKAMGALAYVSAVTFGFSLASLAAEPVRK